MSPPPTTTLKNLTPQDTKLLTQLLTLPPTLPLKTWLLHQPTQISTLPSTSSLLQPKRTLFSLTHTLSHTKKQKQKATLCPSHLALNASLIHEIFTLLTEEISTHLTKLGKHPHLPTEVQEMITQLHSISRLWISSKEGMESKCTSTFPSTFPTATAAQDTKPNEQSFKCLKSGCEACILATVGGDMVSMAALRASILGRRKKGSGKGKVVFLSVVESWIASFEVGDGDGKGILKSSERLSKVVGRCRKEMQVLRRAGRGVSVGAGGCDNEEKEGLLSPVAGEDSDCDCDGGGGGGDFENEIIEEYTDHVCTEPLGARKISGDEESLRYTAEQRAREYREVAGIDEGEEELLRR